MNTYLIPIDDVNMEGPYIMSVHADSLSDAKDVIEEQLRYDYEVKNTGSWMDFVKEMAEIEVYLGTIYDKDEF
jgi:hypothetical protein